MLRYASQPCMQNPQGRYYNKCESTAASLPQRLKRNQVLGVEMQYWRAENRTVEGFVKVIESKVGFAAEVYRQIPKRNQSRSK